MSYPPPFIHAGLPPLNQPPPNFRPPTIGSRPQLYATFQPAQQPPEKIEPKGPLITVFVGNISERIPDAMMKQLLATCGTVINWKRVSTFGYCEYDGAIAGARAVRLLNDLEIDEKKLIAKVDAKNKALLDEFDEEAKKSQTQETQDENAANEKKDDNSAQDIIDEIMAQYADEIKNTPRTVAQEQAQKQAKALRAANVPDEKRDIINQEIGKFRKYTEEAEQKKEKEKKRENERRRQDESPVKRDKKSRRRSHSRSSSGSPKRDRKSKRRSSSRDREKDREREREAEKERERQREKEREKERELEREERERIRERERQIERERREREGITKTAKTIKDLQREKEMEEEVRDRKKREKKAMEKETAYQERLRNWENRERRRAKEYEKEKEREALKEDEREKEAKRLKEFLEDYDDDRDDPRFYKGRELQRRLAERVREADLDAKDRQREQEELEELKSKIFNGDYDNPTQEYEKQKRERESQYKPKLFLHNDKSVRRDGDVRYDNGNDRFVGHTPTNEPIEYEETTSHADDTSLRNHIRRLSVNRGSETRDSHHVIHDDDSRLSLHSAHTPESMGDHGTPTAAPTFQVTLNLNANAKKKKLEVKDVFNNDDDQEDHNGPKKRKLVPLDYDDQAPPAKMAPPQPESKSSSSSSSSRHKNKDSSSSFKDSKESRDSGKDDASKKTDDEKRRHIKEIIDKIPTEKNALFSYALDKKEIDGNIEKKIRPWINKKIIEYIGEPEPTLVDFICSKVMAGSSPQMILDDVQMVLDEEAEVFVVKLWRLLIYDIEAKKLGLTK